MEDLKKIIAVFVKKNVEDISYSTLIDRKGIGGSILIHRMYAAINKAGYKVDNYTKINTYGELISQLNGAGIDLTDKSAKKSNVDYSKTVNNHDTKKSDNSISIGVDIENIDSLPLAVDFREHEFYVNNFSTEEIAYSLLSINPYETFAGLFSAKEALCKVNNSLRERPFNKINICHTSEGMPIFQGYSISISHTKNHSVAVALLNNSFTNTSTQINPDKNTNQETSRLFNEKPGAKTNKIITRISLVASLISLLLALVLLCLYLKR